MLHRLHNKAAHSRHALLQDWSGHWLPAVRAFETRLQFVPDAIVAPLVKILVWPALQIEPRDLRRTHAVERESTLVMHIEQLLARRRRLRKNAEPRKRICTLEDLQRGRRNCRPADSMKSIAPGDKLACDLVLLVF